MECCRVDQIDVSIELVDKGGRTLVPAEALDALLLVPGIAITQVAVKALAENDCSILWCGMEKVHSYAASLGCSSAS